METHHPPLATRPLLSTTRHQLNPAPNQRAWDFFFTSGEDGDHGGQRLCSEPHSAEEPQSSDGDAFIDDDDESGASGDEEGLLDAASHSAPPEEQCACDWAW